MEIDLLNRVAKTEFYDSTCLELLLFFKNEIHRED